MKKPPKELSSPFNAMVGKPYDPAAFSDEALRLGYRSIIVSPSSYDVVIGAGSIAALVDDKNILVKIKIGPG